MQTPPLRRQRARASYTAFLTNISSLLKLSKRTEKGPPRAKTVPFQLLQNQGVTNEAPLLAQENAVVGHLAQERAAPPPEDLIKDVKTWD